MCSIKGISWPEIDILPPKIFDNFSNRARNTAFFNLFVEVYRVSQYLFVLSVAPTTNASKRSPPFAWVPAMRWGHFELLLDTLQAPLNHTKSSLRTPLNLLWNTLKSSLKLTWNTLKSSLKHPKNFLGKSLKFPWKTLEITLKLNWDSFWILFNYPWTPLKTFLKQLI